MNVYLEVYGCTANKADACIIEGVLNKHGYTFVDTIDDADILIILTCTVIGTTEQRMISRLKTLKKTGKTVIVAGCMAAVQSDLIRNVLPTAKLLPPRESHRIIELLGSNVAVVDKKYDAPKTFEGVIAPVGIAEGCLFSCSYCITSKARGTLMSYPVECVVRDVESAVRNGCKEIQLTSQDTASYGLDMGKNLMDILQPICRLPGAFRIRLGMMNPYTVLEHIDVILEAYADSHVYRFLHIPVQSGDNVILQKMGRKYTVEDFISIVKRFRDVYPSISIATDVIVGFPTETEEQFNRTKQLLTVVRPDVINITRFSARPYTAAKTLSGRLPTEIVKKRSKQLTDLCTHISRENNESFIGKTCTVLITEKGKGDTVVGRCESYKPVVIHESVDLGRFISVEITDAETAYLVGTLK